MIGGAEMLIEIIHTCMASFIFFFSVHKATQTIFNNKVLDIVCFVSGLLAMVSFVGLFVSLILKIWV